MDDRQQAITRHCLAAAEGDTMTFPQIVGMLMEAGFESYAVDFRAGRATYYLLDGDSLDLATHGVDTCVTPRLDTSLLQAAIREAQQLAEGYTYNGFCEKAAAAGCAGYIVSFPGRRVLYVGRDAETHIEYFPD